MSWEGQRCCGLRQAGYNAVVELQKPRLLQLAERAGGEVGASMMVHLEGYIDAGG